MAFGNQMTTGTVGDAAVGLQSVRPVALINPVRGIATAIVVAAATSATARSAVIAATAAFVVLALTCAVSIIEVQIITAAKIAVPCC